MLQKEKPHNRFRFNLCRWLLSRETYWTLAECRTFCCNPVKFLRKISWLTCVEQSLEVALVCSALCVYDTHCLRAQNLFKQVTRTDSPHQSSVLLPESWRSYQPIHINQRCGVHGDILTREWLNVLHLTENAQALFPIIYEYEYTQWMPH